MSQKITKLEVNNFIGITEATIEPLKMTVISGKNGKGKTSIVESIRAAFRGAGADKIKLGATKAEIFVSTDEIEVRRRITAAGSTVTVKKGGLTVPKPQAYLDGIIGDFSFEPVKFFAMKADEQTEYLLKAIPVKAKMEQLITWTRGLLTTLDGLLPLHGLEAISQAEKALYDLRAADNSRVKTLEAAISEASAKIPTGVQEVKPEAMKAVVDQIEQARELDRKKKNLEQDIRTSIVDQDELAEELGELNVRIETRDKERVDIEAKSAGLKKVDTEPLEKKRQELLDLVCELEDQIATAKANNQRKIDAGTQLGYLRDGLAEIGERAGVVKTKIKNLEADNGTRKKALLLIKIPADGPLLTQLEEMQKAQAFQRDLDRIEDMRTELTAVSKSAEDRDKAVKTLQTTAPAELLLAAKMPVDGLAYSAGQFALNGVPIQNLSMSEKACLAVAVTRNLNKDYEIKAICLDGFESLDTDTQKAFMEEAAKDDFQYFVTQVQNFDDKGQPLEKLVIESK